MIKQHQGARLGPGGRDSRRGSKADVERDQRRDRDNRDREREREKVDPSKLMGMLTKRKLEKNSGPVSGQKLGWKDTHACPCVHSRPLAPP